METEEMYPAEWDLGEQGAQSSSEFLSIKSGETVRFRIVNGPKAFFSLFCEKYPIVNEKTGETKFGKKGLKLPFGAQIPGYRISPKYLFEVVLIDGRLAGQHKLWDTTQGVFDKINEIRQNWGGKIVNAGIALKRVGEGLETEWFPTAFPPAPLAEGVSLEPQFMLTDKIVYATTEELAKLPPPPKPAKHSDEGTRNVSPAQLKFIGEIMSQKDISEKQALALLKTDKTDIEKLTTAEGSRLIDLLKAA